MKEELTDNGFVELLTANEVDGQLNKEGTTLVMIQFAEVQQVPLALVF